MALHNNSIVVIVPVSLKVNGELMAGALGHLASFETRLSSNGLEPFTHYIMHTWGTKTFADQITGLNIPVIDGYTTEDIEAFLANIIVDVIYESTISSAQHIQAVLSRHNLIKEVKDA